MYVHRATVYVDHGVSLLYTEETTSVDLANYKSLLSKSLNLHSSLKRLFTTVGAPIIKSAIENLYSMCI